MLILKACINQKKHNTMLITKEVHKATESLLKFNHSSNPNATLNNLLVGNKSDVARWLNNYGYLGLDLPQLNANDLTPTIIKTYYDLIREKITNNNTENTRKLLINGTQFYSAAHAMTAIAYGSDKLKMPFDTLNYCVKCDNFKGFSDCVTTIESYNGFDCGTVLKTLKSTLAKGQYFNEGNPNNGNDLFKFYIGREGSPVIYIEYSVLSSLPIPKMIIKKDGIHIEYIEFTMDDFTSMCKDIKNNIGCDEFSIDVEEYTGCTIGKARFWFD